MPLVIKFIHNIFSMDKNWQPGDFFLFSWWWRGIKTTCQLIGIRACYPKDHKISSLKTDCSNTISHSRLIPSLMCNGCRYPKLAGFCQQRCEIFSCKALKLISVEIELFSFVHRNVSTGVSSIEYHCNDNRANKGGYLV